MLRQLLDYAYKHAEVSLALPFDGLTIKEAHQLEAFDKMLKDAKGKGLRVYAVAPYSERMNEFCVREIRDIAYLYVTMGSPSRIELGYDLNNPDSTIGKAVENLTRSSPVDLLKKYICQEFFEREVTIVKI